MNLEIRLFELKKGIPYYNGTKLKTRTNTQGYNYVNINKKTLRLHRLIAKKYIPNPKNYPVVNHINGNKNDNSLLNLEWTTYKSNSKHSLLLNPYQCGFNQRRVKAVSPSGEVIEYDSVNECARQLKRNKAAVTRCCQGEWNKCAGYKLSYI